jgi:chloride channel 2
MVSCTLPVPAGIFVPAFKMGAGLGRLAGELMHYFCPLGVAYGGHIQKILPGTIAWLVNHVKYYSGEVIQVEN